MAQRSHLTNMLNSDDTCVREMIRASLLLDFRKTDGLEIHGAQNLHYWSCLKLQGKMATLAFTDHSVSHTLRITHTPSTVTPLRITHTPYHTHTIYSNSTLYHTHCSRETGAPERASDPKLLVQSMLDISWHPSTTPTPCAALSLEWSTAQLTMGDTFCLMFWSRPLEQRAAICLLILHAPSVYVELIANLQAV